MSERLSAYKHGVIVKETCSRSFKGQVVLSKPILMGDEAFQTYLSNSRDACEQCDFRKEQYCLQLNTIGKAIAETLSGEKLMRELKQNDAPCVTNRLVTSINSFIFNIKKTLLSEIYIFLK
ncbi:MAG: hypothetical protein ABIJ82_00960 [Patescibacteria group bacterium]